MCKIFEREKEEKIRIVEKNDFFIAFVPFSAKMLYEIQIVPLNHHKSIAECSLEELESFGSIIQKIRKRYDLLFEIKKASFMMMLFNAPVFKPGKEFIFHYYLQFVCLDRDEKNYKYRASVETGLHIWTNDSSPESIAEQFKNL
jgi:UDPglucose--hexose-1-phosphate uridylyltransferase